MRARRGLVAASGLAAALVLPQAALGVTSSAAAQTPLSEGSLLSRLVTPAAQLTPLPAGATVTLLSSHDMTGGNIDGGSYNDTLGMTLPHTYERVEDGAYVLADVPGPGHL